MILRREICQLLPLIQRKTLLHHFWIQQWIRARRHFEERGVRLGRRGHGGCGEGDCKEIEKEKKKRIAFLFLSTESWIGGKCGYHRERGQCLGGPSRECGWWGGWRGRLSIPTVVRGAAELRHWPGSPHLPVWEDLWRPGHGGEQQPTSQLLKLLPATRDLPTAHGGPQPKDGDPDQVCGDWPVLLIPRFTWGRGAFIRHLVSRRGARRRLVYCGRWQQCEWKPLPATKRSPKSLCQQHLHGQQPLPLTSS